MDERSEKRKEARNGPRAAHLFGTVAKTKDPTEAKAKAKVRAGPDVATIAESRGAKGMKCLPCN